MYSYVEDGSLAWTNVGHTEISNETICSIICSDYWDENPFGNEADLPADFGVIRFSPYSGAWTNYTPHQWAVDDDGSIILKQLPGWPLTGQTHFLKIRRDGANYIDGSAKRITSQTGITYNTQSDLINGYNGANSYEHGATQWPEHYFDKGTGFPMSKMIKYVIDGTLKYETTTDYTGKFYIAALINGHGSIEFFPNSATYFDCFYHEASYGLLVGGSAGTSNVVSWLGDGGDTPKENIHNGSMIGYGSSLPHWGRDVTSGNSWVGFELNQSNTITSYRIWPLAGKRVGSEVGGTFFRETTAPRDWTIQGSNDNSSWTIIDTQTDETFPTVGLTDSEAQSAFGNDVLLDAETDALQYSNLYNIANPGSYKYYKINITDTSNRTYDNWTFLTEMAYYI